MSAIPSVRRVPVAYENKYPLMALAVMPRLVLVGFAVALLMSAAILTAALWMPAADSGWLWLSRLALLGTLIAALCRAHSMPLLLLSPPVLLGTVGGVLFIVAPVVYVTVYDYVPIGVAFHTSWPTARTREYIGSKAALLVSGVSMLLLLLGLAIDRLVPARPWNDLHPHQLGRAGVLLCGLFLTVSALVLLRSYLALDPAATSHPMAWQVQLALDSALPLLSVGLVTSASLISDGNARAWLLLVAMAVAGALAVLLLAAMKIVSCALAAAITLLSVRRRYWKRFLLTALAGIVVVTAGFIVLVSVLREETNQGYVLPFASKMAVRQGWTGYCLANVMDRHLDQDSEASPLYFFAALIPRPLWPTKPSISHGAHYALTYCGMKLEDINPAKPHSAAITLLGDPIINGGRKGLFVALAALIAVVGAAGVLLQGGRRTIRIGVVAFLPWLVDFEQSFAFYLANAVKAALYMVPFLAAYAALDLWTGRERPRT